MTDRRTTEIVLLLVTVIWGGTFLVSQAALADAGPFGLLATRFSLGAATLFAVFRNRMRGLRRDEVGAGILIGLATFASYAFQTTGLQLVTSSKSAFITALYVPLVPLLQLAILGDAPRFSAWLGIAVSFTGLLILSADNGAIGSFTLGEWLTLGGAVMAAVQIVLISRWARRSDPMRLAFVQLAVVAVLATAALAVAGEELPHLTPSFLLASVALGLLGTAFALGAMNWAQQTVSATRATIIYAMEPVWAALFGAIAGERMTPAIIGGSALIVLGVIVSELRWTRHGSDGAI